jgi:hypothetical protein
MQAVLNGVLPRAACLRHHLHQNHARLLLVPKHLSPI